MEDTKSKIVAEFRVTEITERDQYLDEYTNCILCGTELEYEHQTDFIYLTVDEQANCPHCHIQTKQKSHRLQ